MLPFRSSNRQFAAVLGITCGVVALAACSSSSSTPTSAATSGSPSSTATGSGPVDVLYAGSLVGIMQNQIGPAFHTATGYSVNGISAGSKDLASEIKGKVHVGDVFISASPKVNATLQGSKNGNWVNWYLTFASSGLVLGYNANSKFAADLKSKAWYDVITEPGIRVGFTDPATDPKGELTAEALSDTAKSKNLPALNTLAANKSDVFPEETLVGRLQSGQLDAGFFYTIEADAAKIPTVPLTGTDLKATYTITVLNNAPDEAGAEAFVSYLLGPDGLATLQQNGFKLTTPPKLSGSGLPSSLQSLMS